MSSSEAPATGRRIAVVGIGAMGLPIALRLHERGHAVTVRDLDPAREQTAAAAGCRVAATPAAAAAGAELLIVVVVDGAQTHQVLFGADGQSGAAGAAGAAGAMAPPAAVMLCPTIAPADTEAVAARLAALGIETLDAPMSGGPARARAGTMSLMVACSERAFARWRGLLAQMAGALFHVGTRAGDGARTKLVNNLLAAVNLAGAAEALALAARLGLDPAATLAVIERSSGQSWIGSDRLGRALAEQAARAAGAPAAEPLARVALLAKDAALALDCARQAGLPAALGAAAAAQFARAVAAGLADADDSVLWQLAADRAPAT